MDAHSEARLSQVFQKLADKIRTMADMLSGEGITIIVTQGLRTVAEQQALYDQGRTKPGKIVTNAPGGYSWHNFGLAVDCAVENPDGSIDWNAWHPAWKRMEEVGISLGLVNGAHWLHRPDAPHFQMTGRFPEGAPNDEARELAQYNLENLWNQIE